MGAISIGTDIGSTVGVLTNWKSGLSNCFFVAGGLLGEAKKHNYWSLNSYEKWITSLGGWRSNHLWVEQRCYIKIGWNMEVQCIHFLHRQSWLLRKKVYNYSPKLSLSRNWITNKMVGNWGHDPIRLCLLNWNRVPRFRVNITPFHSMVNNYNEDWYRQIYVWCSHHEW